MAKREPIQKPEPFKKQAKLFEDDEQIQPKQKWNPYIDRKGIDQKARSMIKQGHATYSKSFNTITCHLCGNTSDWHLEVKGNYCSKCNVSHDTDYAEDK